MKKITLSLLLASSLMIAAEVAVDQTKLASDISDAKANLKALEAQLPPKEQNQDIITHVQLGYIQTDGNANTETFAVDGSFKKAWGKNSGSIIFNSQYGEAENVENKNKYFMELQYAYAFSKKVSFTYILGYKNDKFSSYTYQAYTGPGAKYHAYNSDVQKLDLEGSILYSQDELQAQNVIAPNDAISTYTSYQAKLAYEIQVLGNLKFNQDLSYRASFEDSNNFFIFSSSALSSKISDIFSAGISYKVDYTNEVAAGILQRDNTLSAFLSLDY
ncbi:DUF481 domain-containing protein [Sulfurimonas sp. SAG-AH-194-C21]|nr:DUF481 domain-containing protein [Sulfurimonas sp. SAG-AH-194-C21]MDF1883139.1 DUF481 domain-containing protein [Sulfurimonas sp. SAG-AH-194-C21]